MSYSSIASVQHGWWFIERSYTDGTLTFIHFQNHFNLSQTAKDHNSGTEAYWNAQQWLPVWIKWQNTSFVWILKYTNNNIDRSFRNVLFKKQNIFYLKFYTSL